MQAAQIRFRFRPTILILSDSSMWLYFFYYYQSVLLTRIIKIKNLQTFCILFENWRFSVKGDYIYYRKRPKKVRKEQLAY